MEPLPESAAGRRSSLEWEVHIHPLESDQYSAVDDKAVLMRYLPTVEPVDSGLTRITLGASKDGQLVLAGFDASNVNNISLLDPPSGTHRKLLDGASEMELYRLESGPESGKALFAGLRFANNEYVFGSIDVRTGAIEILANTGQKWQDFDAFE